MKKHIGSAWLVIVGLISAVIQFVPDAMQQAWLLLPDELKATVPPLAVKWITYTLFALSMISKAYKNYREKKKLEKELEYVRNDGPVSAVDSGGAGGSFRSTGLRQDEAGAGEAAGETGPGASGQ